MTSPGVNSNSSNDPSILGYLKQQDAALTSQSQVGSGGSGIKLPTTTTTVLQQVKDQQTKGAQNTSAVNGKDTIQSCSDSESPPTAPSAPSSGPGH